MKVVYRQGNLLESDVFILVHQVNCMNKMGSGIAKQIRNKWPEVYRCYQNYCMRAFDNTDLMGTIGEAYTSDGSHLIINLFGQYGYGRDRQHTNYKAVAKAFTELKNNIDHYRYIRLNTIENAIAIPYGMGCGLGGGDWWLYLGIIESVFEDTDVTIYIYKYEGE